MEVVVTGHNFESILPKDHPCHVCFKLADWFQKRKLLNKPLAAINYFLNNLFLFSVPIDLRMLRSGVLPV
jgi:hypothetical protein